MTCHYDYPEPVVTFGVVLENQLEDAYHREMYLNDYGDYDDWEEAAFQLARIEWWNDQWQRLCPGATVCHHGLSLQYCIDPVNHYEPDM